MIDREAQRAGGGYHAVVVAGEINCLSLPLEKVDGRQMNGVEGSDRLGKRFQRSGKHRRGELDQRYASQ